MLRHLLLIILFFLMIPAVAQADELLPASSEDLEQFDRAVANQKTSHAEGAAVSKKHDGFGHDVAKEAHKLKDETAGRKKDSLRWGQQRERFDHGSPASPDERSGNGGSGKGHRRSGH